MKIKNISLPSENASKINDSCQYYKCVHFLGQKIDVNKVKCVCARSPLKDTQGKFRY